jgi:Skp family chaperone for outer membrane proteins
MAKEGAEQQARARWLAAAGHTARRCNWAWFLDKLSLPLLLTGLIGAVAILLIRREGALFPWSFVGVAMLVILAIVSLLAWLLAKRNFTTRENALVRLEEAMGFDNALTAAHHGIAPWPEALPKVSDGTTWNWSRLLLPPLATLILLFTAFLLPISARSKTPPPEEPAARQALQASLDELAEEEVVDEDYLEEMQKKVEELRKQPPEDWFDHSALEATDSLKKSHEQQLQELEQDLQKAERALNALQNHNSSLSPENQERLRNEFDEAVEKMSQGAMKPNQELLEQLGGIDPGQLKNLSGEQLDQLRQNMRQQAQKMKGANNPGQQGEGGDWLDELMQEGGQGQNNQPGQGPGPNGEGPGQGGINRGPGTAPGVLGEKGEELKTGDREGLESRDLSNTLPGDLLQLQDGEHEIDQSDIAIRQGGEVDNLGQGGELIWKVAPDLAPAEKKALRNFFK